jgi:hypothetical protein
MRGFRVGVVIAAALVVLGLVWMHQPAADGHAGAIDHHHHLCPDDGCLPHAVHFGAACLALAAAVVVRVRKPPTRTLRPVFVDTGPPPAPPLRSFDADPPSRGGRAALSRHCILRC